MTGPDRAEVRRIADEVGEVMRATPQLGNVHDDWLEPVPSLKLEIDQDRARALGVTSQAVRRSLQAHACPASRSASSATATRPSR